MGSDARRGAGPRPGDAARDRDVGDVRPGDAVGGAARHPHARAVRQLCLARPVSSRPPSGPGAIASISTSSSAVGRQAPAATFACTCSALVAPAITDATAGCAASAPIATSSNARPCSSAQARSASTRSSLASVTNAGGAGQPRAGRDPPVAGDLAGQQALGQREERQDAQAEVLARPGPPRARSRAPAASTRSARRRTASSRRRPRGARRRRSASRRGSSARCSGPCPRGPARAARPGSPRSGSPGPARAAGTGRCGRCAAGAATARPRTGRRSGCPGTGRSG